MPEVLLTQDDLDRIADRVERWYVMGRPRIDAIMHSLGIVLGRLPLGENRDLAARLGERIERWYRNGSGPMKEITEELRSGGRKAE